MKGWLQVCQACHDACRVREPRKQLACKSSEGESEAGHGLLARALWHARNPSKQTSKTAWVRTLSELRTSQKAARPEAVKIIAHSITFMTSTCNVERWLHELSLSEQKSRAHHLSVFRLEDAVKLNVQNMSGSRTGMQANDLTTTPAESEARGVQWQASNFGLRSQTAYRDFFGERVLPARDILTPESRNDKPRLAALRNSSAKSLKSQISAHSAALDTSVAESVSSSSSSCKKNLMDDFVAAASEFVSSTLAGTSGTLAIFQNDPHQDCFIIVHVYSSSPLR